MLKKCVKRCLGVGEKISYFIVKTGPENHISYLPIFVKSSVLLRGPKLLIMSGLGNPGVRTRL